MHPLRLAPNAALCAMPASDSQPCLRSSADAGSISFYIPAPVQNTVLEPTSISGADLLPRAPHRSNLPCRCRFGWHDSYTYSKALAELAAVRAAKEQKMPMLILRPTIVESAMREPAPCVPLPMRTTRAGRPMQPVRSMRTCWGTSLTTHNVGRLVVP